MLNAFFMRHFCHANGHSAAVFPPLTRLDGSAIKQAMKTQLAITGICIIG
jgi:hypothetical protein